MKTVIRVVSAVALAAAMVGCGNSAAKPQDAASAGKVKNVIFLIGDGMGLPQITALAVEQNMEPLQIERTQYVGIQKTYSNNNRVTDSAAAGTALATGTKTDNGHVGVDPAGTQLESSLEVARSLGKATAVVVTSSITDATPAAFMAGNPDRGNHADIAAQIAASGVDVLSGAGREWFDGSATERDLIGEMASHGYKVAGTVSDLLAIDSAPAVALFDGFPYMVDDTQGLRGDYLRSAAGKAIELIGGDEDGFFMMVEGSMIDWAGHDNNIERVLGEIRDFDALVGAMFDYADAHPGTLVVVTGDHETGGLTITSPVDDFTQGSEGVVYEFSTSDHSATFLPVFAYGTEAERFAGVMENTDIAKRIKAAME